MAAAIDISAAWPSDRPREQCAAHAARTFKPQQNTRSEKKRKKDHRKHAKASSLKAPAKKKKMNAAQISHGTKILEATVYVNEMLDFTTNRRWKGALVYFRHVKSTVEHRNIDVARNSRWRHQFSDFAHQPISSHRRWPFVKPSHCGTNEEKVNKAGNIRDLRLCCQCPCSRLVYMFHDILAF